jgi:Icc-related predicted phosphoesterase
VKVLSVSDTVVHELYEDFDPGLVRGVELILACGDLPPEYLSFLRDRVNAPLYYVQGNHDIRYLEAPPIGCLDVHQRLVRVGDYRLLGLSGSRWYNGGVNQFHEFEMKRILRGLWLQIRLAGGVDIIISHAPLRHVGDRDDPCHKGFTCYRRLINKYRPRWFIHGHIHARFSGQDERISILKSTQVMNTYGYVCFEL